MYRKMVVAGITELNFKIVNQLIEKILVYVSNRAGTNKAIRRMP